jgi:hypothetical protein
MATMKSPSSNPSLVRLRACLFGIALAVLTFGTGCQQKMADQPSYKPLDANTFFPDGRSARPVVAGTVARGHLQLNRALQTGRRSGERKALVKPPAPNSEQDADAQELLAREAEENNDFVSEFPLPVSRAMIEHGQQRYMIYCVVCHDPLGTGRGKIVERGFTRPPSYHVDRLREAPVGRLFAVMSDGYGSMPSYAAQVPVRDRWAIAAYVRALQLSQHFPQDDLPQDVERRWLNQELRPEPAEREVP